MCSPFLYACIWKSACELYAKSCASRLRFAPSRSWASPTRKKSIPPSQTTPCGAIRIVDACFTSNTLSCFFVFRLYHNGYGIFCQFGIFHKVCTFSLYSFHNFFSVAIIPFFQRTGSFEAVVHILFLCLYPPMHRIYKKYTKKFTKSSKILNPLLFDFVLKSHRRPW